MSLREIRIAAGQRNSSALQFHFGGREGLLQALAQRHLPRLAAVQDRLYADLVAAGGRDDLGGLIEVLVRPQADYVRLGPSERAWIMVCAEQAARPDVVLADVLGNAPATALHVGAAIHERLAPTLGAGLAIERIVAVATACLHLSADRARAEDALAQPAAASIRPTLAFEAWRDNLLDMAVAAISAPARDRSAAGGALRN